MKKYLAIALMLCLLPAAGWGATYYMRADGSAANKAAATSCSAAASAMSIATHNSETLAAGDTITLCDSGGVFNTTIIPPTAGASAASKVTYTASGNPVVTSATTATGWAAGPVYTISEADTVYIVYEDAVPLQKATSTACADGNWYASGGTLYYKPTSGLPSAHVVIYNTSTYASGIYLNGKSFVTITGIEFKNNYYGIYAGAGSSGLTVTSCRFLNGLQGFVQWTTTSTSGHSITNNYFYRLSLGIGHSVNSGTPTFSASTISGNTLVDIGTVDGTVKWTDLLVATLDLEAISGQNLSGYTISGNTITGGYHYPIYIYSINGVVCDGNTISKNIIKNNAGGNLYGLALSGDETGGHINTIIAHNLMDNNGSACSVWLKNGLDANAQNYIYNNTIINGVSGIAIQTPGGTDSFFTIKNNIISGNSNYNIFLFPAYEDTILIDYNAYGGTAGNVFATNTSAEDWTTWKAHGFDAHSVSGDPLLNADGTLKPGSPAIGAGTPIWTYAEWVAMGGDLAGRNPTNGTYSMGAYQFQKKKSLFPALPIWAVSTKASKATDTGSYVAAAGGDTWQGTSMTWQGDVVTW